jgi:hypothetical protein
MPPKPTPRGLPSLLDSGYRVIPGVKQPKRGADNPHSSSAGVRVTVPPPPLGACIGMLWGGGKGVGQLYLYLVDIRDEKHKCTHLKLFRVALETDLRNEAVGKD